MKGLYSTDYEHDACGVGMVVNIHGGKSHELVDNALKVLEHMEHRGAETRDKTGDGAGILVQIPHEFILLQGIPVPEKGHYGTGLIFLPKDSKRQNDILSIVIEEIEKDYNKYVIASDEVVDYEKIFLTKLQTERMLNGVYEISCENGEIFRVYSPDRFLGIGVGENGKLKIKAYINAVGI